MLVEDFNYLDSILITPQSLPDYLESSIRNLYQAFKKYLFVDVDAASVFLDLVNKDELHGELRSFYYLVSGLLLEERGFWFEAVRAYKDSAKNSATPAIPASCAELLQAKLN